FAVASDGIVIRTRVEELRASGRDTMGVRLMNLGDDRSLVAVARAGDREEGDNGHDSASDDVAEGESDAPQG
ncbi:MAG: DNA gyrase C-terminal beta-propeller domain-containing protein, partial [Actinomycetota bacterium]